MNHSQMPLCALLFVHSLLQDDLDQTVEREGSRFGVPLDQRKIPEDGNRQIELIQVCEKGIPGARVLCVTQVSHTGEKEFLGNALCTEECTETEQIGCQVVAQIGRI
jgi:hypothetical protein